MARYVSAKIAVAECDVCGFVIDLKTKESYKKGETQT